MGKSLLIVESPTKVNTLKKIVGKDFIIKASVGHLKDLPKKKLGVDVDNDFAPEYITIRGKGKILQELKTAAKKCDMIYLAPDPDREGEAIAHHIGNEVARFTKGKIVRVTFNEITKKAVLEAIKNPTELNHNRVNAQQARRILDRLVGYKISPILWKKVHRGLSAGRVQSVALRIVCEREREILAFEPREYWSITLELEGSEKPQFQAKLFKIDGDKAEVANKAEADEILKGLEGAKPVLEDIVKKERKRNEKSFGVWEYHLKDLILPVDISSREKIFSSLLIQPGDSVIIKPDSVLAFNLENSKNISIGSSIGTITANGREIHMIKGENIWDIFAEFYDENVEENEVVHSWYHTPLVSGSIKYDGSYFKHKARIYSVDHEQLKGNRIKIINTSNISSIRVWI